MTLVAAIDAETTGLREDSDPWEIAIIVRDHPVEHYNGEWLWQIRPDLTNAEPMGLRIGRFYERFRLNDPKYVIGTRSALIQAPTHQCGPVQPELVAYQICLLLDGGTWVGAVPNFDELRIGRFVRRNGYCLTNHYHLVDVEAAVAGYLAASGDVRLPPWNSRELTAAVGVEQVEDETHTALGDARWALRAFDAVFGTPVYEAEPADPFPATVTAS